MINPTSHPVHELISARHSPYGIDPDKGVSTDDLYSLFEAARWSMSAFNAQPWRYIVANKTSNKGLWSQVLSTLVDGNQAWARFAPVLALGLIETTFQHNGKDNATAQHDLGAASAFLTLEATARQLVVHQMAGIHPDKVRESFELPDTVQPFTALAIGYHGENSHLDEQYHQRDQQERRRLPHNELLLHSAL